MATTQQVPTVAEAGEHVGDRYVIPGRVNVNGKSAEHPASDMIRRAPATAVLMGLDVLMQHNNALIRWSTLSENDNVGFELEYRYHDNDMPYTAIGFIPGAGTTSAPRLYRFGVTNLLEGTHLFRLRIVRADGAISYSDPVRIDVGSEPSFALGIAAHDPDLGAYYVPYTLRMPGIIRLIVTDADGKLVDTVAFGTHEAGTHIGVFKDSAIRGEGYTITLHTESGSTSRPICTGESAEACR